MKLFIDTRSTLEECKRLLRVVSKSDNLNNAAEAKILVSKIETLVTRLNRAIDN